MKSRITAVLFDLGETLTHSPEAALDQGLRLAQARVDALLHSWGLAPHASLARQAYEAAQAAELAAYRGDCALPPLWSVAREAAAARGIRLVEAQARELWEACRIDERALGRTLAADGMQTLAWLKGRGFRLGCVTNTLFGGPPFLEGLRQDGLEPFLGVVAISCDLGFIKPHPEIFRFALDTLDVPPEQTLMVGDSLRADVGGAKALGMTAVWKRRSDGFPEIERALMRAGLEPAFEPDYVIDSLWQLTELPLLNHD
ncbi:MAG: HAD family hydrolase [Chloroflexi bacterium]|nr:HAD family hydrolase [Chloroflexota bacterium]